MYRHAMKHTNREIWVLNPHLKICGLVDTLNPNSGLAQVLNVLVDKTYMVAEHCLSLRLPSFSANPVSRASQAMDFTPNFVMNMAQKEANERSFETMAMMAGAAITAKATFNMGGRVVNFVWDKARNIWKEEQQTPLSMAVETYNMSSSVSLLTSPIPTPDKKADAQEDRDKQIQQLSWVEKEIARLEQQNLDLKNEKLDLKKKNEAQGQIILAFHEEKQATPKQLRQPDAQQDNNKGEDPLYTTNDPWPAGGMKADDHGRPPQQHNALQVHDHQQVDDNLLVQDRDRRIQNAVKMYAQHVRELETKCEKVIINNINVVDNLLVHNWGQMVRAELSASEVYTGNTKVQTLQDVRLAGREYDYITRTQKIRQSITSPSNSSPGNTSTYGGDINRLENNNGGNGDGSPGGTWWWT